MSDELTKDETRIVLTLERASATIKNLRAQLDIALEALEFCAAGDSLSQLVAIETLERIDAAMSSETVQ